MQILLRHLMDSQGWFGLAFALSLSLSDAFLTSEAARLEGGGVLRISIAILRGLAKDCRLVLFQI